MSRRSQTSTSVLLPGFVLIQEERTLTDVADSTSPKAEMHFIRSVEY